MPRQPRDRAERRRLEQPIEPFLSTKEVADLLGRTARSVTALAAQGEIPHYRHGKLLRFRASELEAWAQARRVRAS